MKFRLKKLLVRTKKTIEKVEFSNTVTFIYGPIGKGKSTVARLVDYCLGGYLERTPAIQSEFISTELELDLGTNKCLIERTATDNANVRFTWVNIDEESYSIIAPFEPKEQPLIESYEVYNLSDLLFFLLGVQPIKVRKNRTDPESPLVRLSFRDIWWYCYLEQTHLDSSFFRLEDTFRGRKSQDALRFFTGLHSEKLSQLEMELLQTIEKQKTKTESILQIQEFMKRFELGSEIEIEGRFLELNTELKNYIKTREELEKGRFENIHPSDELRITLRALGEQINSLNLAINESQEMLNEQVALRSELLTAKTKSLRSEKAGQLLSFANLQYCPECGFDISTRVDDHVHCCLCGSEKPLKKNDPIQIETQNREINDRIDQLFDSIQRRERAIERMKRQLSVEVEEKRRLDLQLVEEIKRYDSSFVEQIRQSERLIATVEEKIRSLQQLKKMPEAIAVLEQEAESMQTKIGLLRTAFTNERDKLRQADELVKKIAEKFHQILLSVGFPGVSKNDGVVLDPRNWRPYIIHDQTEWSFWDTGSGGKKTLFNVCYALALHTVAIENSLPLPNILVIDSPTKNISEDMNPELVQALYREIYKLAGSAENRGIQFLLIDSEIVLPPKDFVGFKNQRMTGESDAPSLISYYDGP